jgi:hypothetical protein
VKTKWENSSWGKKLIVQKRRASLNDFDRFKVMLAKIKVRNLPVKCLVPVDSVYIAGQAEEGVHGLRSLFP